MVLYAVRHEMAQKLSDVVFRRTWLGGGVYPGETHLRECVAVMCRELGWDGVRARIEVEEVNTLFQCQTGGGKIGLDNGSQAWFTAAR
jgi:glycerol-3-phosphate dehydrogenase